MTVREPRPHTTPRDGRTRHRQDSPHRATGAIFAGPLTHLWTAPAAPGPDPPTGGQRDPDRGVDSPALPAWLLRRPTGPAARPAHTPQLVPHLTIGCATARTQAAAPFTPNSRVSLPRPVHELGPAVDQLTPPRRGQHELPLTVVIVLIGVECRASTLQEPLSVDAPRAMWTSAWRPSAA